MFFEQCPHAEKFKTSYQAKMKQTLLKVIAIQFTKYIFSSLFNADRVTESTISKTSICKQNLFLTKQVDSQLIFIID